VRIILRLRPLSQFTPNFEYHNKVQGFIYSLLKNTSFEELHNKKGYKFFCFSNLFAAQKNTQINSFNLIISSPLPKFIEQLSYQLQKIIDYQIPIQIGSIFELKGFMLIENRNLSFPLEIITGTPILIRIPTERFAEFSVESAQYKSIYWRSSHPIHLFVDALESNLKKKYQQFTDSPISTQRILEKFIFKKQVSTNIYEGNCRKDN
jgi:CRISPR-associated endoribonuclease Cas6